jgi:hypothetical protein
VDSKIARTVKSLDESERTVKHIGKVFANIEENEGKVSAPRIIQCARKETFCDFEECIVYREFNIVTRLVTVDGVLD